MDIIVCLYSYSIAYSVVHLKISLRLSFFFFFFQKYKQIACNFVDIYYTFAVIKDEDVDLFMFEADNSKVLRVKVEKSKLLNFGC